MFMTPLSSSEIDAYNLKGGSQADSTDPKVAQDRFLKLFVAQLSNQDPLNPLDNAQMTTQMAQINTVTGLQQVNQTLKSLAEQFTAVQSIQGATLVGRQVITQGNQLSIDGNVAKGSFSLSSSVDSLQVDVVDSAGAILGTVNLGARSAGMHNFEWPFGDIDPSRIAKMQVTATSGGQSVAVTPLSRQRVDAVGMVDGTLRLRTENGSSVSYGDVLAFL
ncbi:flagellar hook assembly protein FlgD [Hydrogenophaga aquatica]